MRHLSQDLGNSGHQATPAELTVALRISDRPAAGRPRLLTHSRRGTHKSAVSISRASRACPVVLIARSASWSAQTTQESLRGKLRACSMIRRATNGGTPKASCKASRRFTRGQQHTRPVQQPELPGNHEEDVRRRLLAQDLCKVPHRLVGALFSMASTSMKIVLSTGGSRRLYVSPCDARALSRVGKDLLDLQTQLPQPGPTNAINASMASGV